MNVPVAKKIPNKTVIHDTEISDEYAWIRDPNWSGTGNVDDKDILAYLNEENAYFTKFIDSFKGQKEVLFQELKGRIKLADQSTYVKRDNYYYYSRTLADKNYSIYCRKKDSTNNAEQILLDVNKLAEGKSFTRIGAFSISPDHKLMSYSVDYAGDEKYTIKVFDFNKQEYLKDEIPGTIGGIVWHENLNGFFYTPVDEQWRHNKIKFHRLGEDYKSDIIVFHEKDVLYSISVSKSSSKEYIFINVSGHDNNEEYLIRMDDRADSGNFDVQLIKPKKEKILYSVDHGGKYFYMHTNDGAKDFHILRAESNKFQEEQNWSIYVPEESGKYLSDFDLTKSYLLLNYTVNALPMLMVKKHDTKISQIIKFPDAAYTAGVYTTNFIEDDIRIGYSSLARPSTVFTYNAEEDLLEILKQQEIPSGFNHDQYHVERIFARNDDVSVPITLFYKKSLYTANGNNPLYLYGYGSYGHAISPSFSSTAVSLADRGFVYAIAHIRGGDDLGHEWYEDAKFLNKKRTFSDFIAVTKYLINKRYTSNGNIVIAGGSAGGMLVGNVINQVPELYKAVVAHVPFVDVLNTMLDETLPLTPGEYKEWGNPKEKEYFDYIRSYCPYSNVKKQNYPHIFVTAGLSDPRVGYWEAAKWVARLRDRKTDNNKILFKTNMEFGHQGASGRFDYLYDVAEELIFIFQIFGIDFN